MKISTNENKPLVIGVKIQHRVTKLFRNKDGVYTRVGKVYGAIGHAKSSVSQLDFDEINRHKDEINSVFVVYYNDGSIKCESVAYYIVDKINREIAEINWEASKQRLRLNRQNIIKYCSEVGINITKKYIDDQPLVLECPCCNSKGNRIRLRGKFGIACSKCGVNTGYFNTESEALNTWNTRIDNYKTEDRVSW